MDTKNAVAERKEQGVALYKSNEGLVNVQEQMSGLDIEFQRIKIPSGGGLAFELPSDDPDNPDVAKEIKGVILYHHTIRVFYKEAYTGGSERPDCCSLDGKNGIDINDPFPGNCERCSRNQFGSADDGVSKACKTKQRIYILREGELLPTIINAPTGSLKEIRDYMQRLLTKGKFYNTVETKFTLRKAENKKGIKYSQIVAVAERTLAKEEQDYINVMTSEIKKVAHKVEVQQDDAD